MFLLDIVFLLISSPWTIVQLIFDWWLMKGRILKFIFISLIQQKVVYNEVVLPGVSLLLGSYVYHFLSQERERAEVYSYITVISHLIVLFLLDLFTVNFNLLIKIDGGEDKEDPIVRMLLYII